MQRPYYIVDAFTDTRFAGNSAAVVLDADGLDDAQMQAVATEFNLSETTFVLPPTVDDADVRFRWFTPGAEVSMCGHATIAGACVLAWTGRTAAGSAEAPAVIRIETKSGVLAADIGPTPGDREGLLVWLDLPQPKLVTKTVTNLDMAEAFSLPSDSIDRSIPAVKTQDDDLIAFVRDSFALNEAKPDRAALLKICHRDRLRGYCLATVNTLSPSITVQSRFFAPAVGIDEDPVTGSVHGPLAAHLVEQGRVSMQDGIAGLHCVQGIAGGRAGLVRAVVRRTSEGGLAVRIGGEAVAVMRGVLLK